MYSAAYLGRRANFFSNGVNNDVFHKKNVLLERTFSGQNNPRMKVKLTWHAASDGGFRDANHLCALRGLCQIKISPEGSRVHLRIGEFTCGQFRRFWHPDFRPVGSVKTICTYHVYCTRRCAALRGKARRRGATERAPSRAKNVLGEAHANDVELKTNYG